MANVIDVGNKVDLRIVKRERTSNGIEKNYRTYKSKIFDIIDSNTIKIAMPIEGGNVILLPLEQKFEIFFYTTKGLYQSEGKVINRIKENNIFVLIFELTASIKKNQRREYFRFDCTIDVKYFIITEYESSLVFQEEIEEARDKKIEWKNGFIVDISAGGIRFTSDEEFVKNSYIMTKFNLMINHRMTEYCTIIKIISSSKILTRSGQYENRGKYFSLGPEETEQIVRYIFEEERKSRKNRKS
ncbi:MAG: flagellar brake protein [Lachnotalea sp.]